MPPAHPFDDDKLHEECGVFGVIGVNDAAKAGATLDSLGDAPAQNSLELSAQNSLSLSESTFAKCCGPGFCSAIRP
mgnify:CR=1 FL=1